MFTENDLNWVYFAKVMRHTGVPVESVVEYVNLFLEGREQTAQARKDILIEQRKCLEEKISELNETLQYLNYKIDDNENHLLNFEKFLEEGYSKK